jgi:hypothetical protein
MGLQGFSHVKGTHKEKVNFKKKNEERLPPTGQVESGISFAI